MAVVKKIVYVPGARIVDEPGTFVNGCSQLQILADPRDTSRYDSDQVSATNYPLDLLLDEP